MTPTRISQYVKKVKMTAFNSVFFGKLISFNGRQHAYSKKHTNTFEYILINFAKPIIQEHNARVLFHFTFP